MRYEEDMRLLLPEDFERYRCVADHPVMGAAGSILEAVNGRYDFTRVRRLKPFGGKILWGGQEPCGTVRPVVSFPGSALHFEI